MPEEERLTLVSDVEDKFTTPLKRLEGSLESVDDEIRDTGRGRDYIRIDVEADISDAVTELAALESGLEALDDDLTVDVDERVGRGDEANRRFDAISEAVESDLSQVSSVDVDAASADVDAARADVDGLTAGGGGPAIADAGEKQRTFTIDNMDEWADSLGPYLDREDLGARGGEVSRIEYAMDRDLTDVIEMDELVRRARDPSDTDINMDMIRGLGGGPSEAVDAIEDISDADSDLTLLGRNPGQNLRFKRFAKEVADMRFTIRGFHQIVAALIPILAVFVGALPAAIVGVGALATAAIGAAAALAGVAGLGALGMMMTGDGLDSQPLMDRLKEVGQTYLDAFGPLAESFAPVLEDAITSIKRMSGPLADASANLLAFRDQFKGFVGYLTTTLPSFTSDFLAFTHAAEPLVTSVITALGQIKWFEYFALQLDRAWTSLKLLGGAFMNILPMVVNLSQGFLKVTATIFTVIGGVAWMLNHFPVFTAVLGAVAASLLTLVSVTTLYSVAQTGLMSTSLGLTKSLITGLIPTLKSTAISLWTSAVAAWGFYGALVAVITAATLGLGAVTLLSSKFGELGSNIGSARKELEKFANGKNALNADSMGVSGGASPTGGSGNYYQDNSKTVIYAGDQDDAARQQYNSDYERQQHVDSVFGG